MDINLLTIVVTVLVSSTIVAVSLPRIMLLSLRKRLIDPIDPRKVHNTTASRLGGVAFYPAIFISVAMCVSIANLYCGAQIDLSQMVILEFASVMMLYLTGYYDDLIGVGYKAKFLVQILTALLAVLSGVYFEYFYAIDFIWEIPLLISIPLTMFLIVFITNSINLIDGINGLASMLSMMALTAYGVLFYFVGDMINAIVCFATAAALAPFWYHNVFGVRRGITSRIFMGDGGALVIGFILSVMAIKLWNHDTASNTPFNPNLFHIIAYTMLFIPCMDVVRIIIHRYRTKQPLFLPDKNHIHHKFMALGYSPRQALWHIIALQVLFVLLNVLMSIKLNVIYILAVDMVVWIAIHIIISKGINRKNNDNK